MCSYGSTSATSSAPAFPSPAGLAGSVLDDPLRERFGHDRRASAPRAPRDPARSSSVVAGVMRSTIVAGRQLACDKAPRSGCGARRSDRRSRFATRPFEGRLSHVRTVNGRVRIVAGREPQRSIPAPFEAHTARRGRGGCRDAPLPTRRLPGRGNSPFP